VGNVGKFGLKMTPRLISFPSLDDVNSFERTWLCDSDECSCALLHNLCLIYLIGSTFSPIRFFL
jgi:hypothetical protein